MRRTARAPLVVFLALLLVGSFARPAAAADGADIELIVDYLGHHQVTVIMSPGLSPDPLVNLVSTIVGSPLRLETDWDADAATHVWLYSAPDLINGYGPSKSVLWDCRELADTAAEMGLPAGVNLFVVVNQPYGAFGYDALVSDQGQELQSAASDEMEIWWGFGLDPGGAAPVLNLSLQLRPRITPLTLFPVWIPGLGAALLWPFRRKELHNYARISRIATWIVIWLAVLSAYLLQWPALANFCLGGPAGLPGQLAFVLVLALGFGWSALIIRLPLEIRLAKERGEPFCLRYYLLQTYRLFCGFALLIAAGLAWFALAKWCYQIGLWLALFAGLFSFVLVAWLAAEFMSALRFGRSREATAEVTTMVQSLATRLCTQAPPTYLIPANRLAEANAFATGLLCPHVHVTEALWEGLTPGERQFILAHELAHLARQDGRRSFLLGLLPTAAIAVGLVTLLFVDAWWPLLVVSGVLIGSVIFTYLVALPARRRMELAADSLAVQATGDVRSALAALHRLSAINKLGNGSRSLTHPLLLERFRALQQNSPGGK